MKFSELDNDQREAFRELLLQLVAAKREEENHYVQQFYKLLVLGNGAGIVLLATFMGAVSSNSEMLSELVSPLVCFCLGAVLAASIYFPLMAVAGTATNVFIKQVNEFFLNAIELEAIKGYGLNRKGVLLVLFLCVSSLLAFAYGLYLCVGVLKGLV